MAIILSTVILNPIVSAAKEIPVVIPLNFACNQGELTEFALIDILIDYQGQLKLSDFGAAKILAKGQKTMGRTSVHMNVNSLAGTPMYMVKKSKLGNLPCFNFILFIIGAGSDYGRRYWT